MQLYNTAICWHLTAQSILFIVVLIVFLKSNIEYMTRLECKQFIISTRQNQ